jgi:hypothetical protein
MRHPGARHFALAVPLRYAGEPFTPIAGTKRAGMQSPVIAIAILLIGIGVFALFAVLLRLT